MSIPRIIITMTIKEPRLNVYNTSANPLMIIGILVFCCPFFMMAFGDSNPVINMILFAIGGIIFGLGVVWYVAENY